MHSAPSVTYPVGRSRWAGSLLAGLGLLALGVVMAWILSVPVAGWRQGLALAAAMACTAMAAMAWLRSPVGRLAWDGGAWVWRAGAGAQAGRLQPALDLQDRMLLRWQPAGGGRPCWFWVERGAAPADWDALRRAVYSRASTAAPHGDPPSVAER